MNDDEKIITFMDKIMPFVKNPNNSEGNLRLYLKHELGKFYEAAFVEGQLSILESDKTITND